MRLPVVRLPVDRPEDLDGVLADLQQAADGVEALSLDETLAVIGARGFGPLLVILAVVLILPVAMIPFLPAVVALVMGLIGIMMLLGRKHLHLPARLGRVRVKSAHINAVATRVRPWTKRLPHLLRPRYAYIATSRPVVVLLGLILIATAAVILVIGFIPFLPFLMALHILLLGLGLTMRDGLAMLAGLLVLLPTVLVVLRFV